MTLYPTAGKAPFSISLLGLLKKAAYINSLIPLLPFFLESTTNRPSTSHSKLLIKVTHTATLLRSTVKSQCSSFDFIDSLHLVSMGIHFLGFPPTLLAAFLVPFAVSFSYPQPLNLEVSQGLSLIKLH